MHKNTHTHTHTHAHTHTHTHTDPWICTRLKDKSWDYFNPTVFFLEGRTPREEPANPLNHTHTHKRMMCDDRKGSQLTNSTCHPPMGFSLFTLTERQETTRQKWDTPGQCVWVCVAIYLTSNVRNHHTKDISTLWGLSSPSQGTVGFKFLRKYISRKRQGKTNFC